MASTLTISLCSSSLVKSNKSTTYSSSLPPCSCSSFSTNSYFKTLNFSPFSRFSQLGLCHFSPWNGLKHLGISISAKPQKIGKGSKCRGKVVYASLFGVGAPEALVIGVVALLVFGPKGLAEVARNLGKTLRAFQPTIKELQEVSREFKNTLEREISLDDDPSETKPTYMSNTTNSVSNSSVSSLGESQTVPMAEPNGAAPSNAYSSEEFLKITEEQLKAQQEAMSSSPESQVEPESQPQASAALQQDVVSSPETKIEPESQTQAVQQDVDSSPPESVVETESLPQATQETATAATSVQKPENEF